MSEIRQTNTQIATLETNFTMHCDKCNASIMRSQLDTSELRTVINTIERKLSSDIKYLEGKHKGLEFEMDQKVRVDHLKQNFK